MIQDKHRQAIAEAAKAAGKTPAEVCDAVSATWPDLSAFDRAVLRHELARNPLPTAADRRAAKVAGEHADQAETRADTRDVRAFRTHEKLRAENPFAAARYRIEHARSIEHGQLLEELNNDPGPEAA